MKILEGLRNFFREAGQAKAHRHHASAEGEKAKKPEGQKSKGFPTKDTMSDAGEKQKKPQ